VPTASPRARLAVVIAAVLLALAGMAAITTASRARGDAVGTRPRLA